MNKSIPRLNLAKHELFKLTPNLIEAHLTSYQELIDSGIKEIFFEINPITDYTGESWELHFADIEWGDKNMSMSQASKLGLSYTAPLHIEAKLVNKKTGEIKKQKLFVADIPMMSDRGTFIINGNERVVVMQVIRAEGALCVESKTTTSTKPLFAVKLMPLRGRWFDFEVNKYGVMSVKLLDKRPRVLLTTLLRALGYSSDSEIRNVCKDADTGDISLIDNTLKKDTTSNTEEALLDIYRKLRPEDSINLENATSFLENMFFNKRRFFLGKTGRYQLNKKLNIQDKITEADYLLKKKDIVHIVRALIELNNGKRLVDDIDSLANRRVRGVGELIGDKIRVGVLRLEKNTRDRMGTYSTEDLVTPSLLVNTKPVSSSINEFFGSSAVSRYMDQENILSELETKRRITAGGPRGLTKERATFSVRDVHSSHYSKLCPVTTPEGPSIGIVSHLAIYARINEYGFIEAPYYRVLSNVKLSEVKAEILVGTVLREDAIDVKGKVILKKAKMIAKDDYVKFEKAGILEIKVEPKISRDITYLASDEELKYHIGSAQIGQDNEGRISIPNTFVRYQGTYAKVPTTELEFIDINPGQVAGLGFSLVPFSYNDDPTRTLMAANMQRQAVPLLSPEAPIVGTGFERVVADSSGRIVRAPEDGEVIASDASSLTVKYPKAGKVNYEVEKFIKTNQNTAFSQKVVVKLNDKIKKGDLLIQGPAMDKEELALGRPLLAAYMVFDGFNFDDGVIISQRLIREDVLTSVHIKEYVQDIRETKLGNEQVTRDIPNVGEYTLRNLDDEGIVRVGASVASQDILVGIIAPKGETELTAEEKLLRAIFGEYARDVRDNSLRLPHGDKGIVIGVQILDKIKGDKLNPGVLKQVKVWVARTQKISIGDKLTGLHGDKGVVAKILHDDDMPYLADGTKIDIILSPMFVKRMNLGQLRELEIGAMAKAVGIKVEIPPFAELDFEKLYEAMAKKNIKVELKQKLFDGRTGLPYKQKVLVGPRYILKLNHLSSDKIHARSTGSYTLVTQQPLGGKAQFGGQRFGEMEVWALEAHAAVHNLQELLTIKSDDVVGRAAAYKSIIQGTPIEAPNIPESFKVFMSELRALGISPELVEPDEDDRDELEVIEEAIDDYSGGTPSTETVVEEVSE
ncbi:MAG: DNA-directed RNA polymerase subunit beta [bacterium]